jgi:hypothetical protein
MQQIVMYTLARSPHYWDAALELLRGMMDSAPASLKAPSQSMYINGIIACDTGGDWESAIYLLDAMQRLGGFPVTPVALAAALAACASKGRAEEAMMLLDQYEHCASLYAYNSVIAACAKAATTVTGGLQKHNNMCIQMHIHINNIIMPLHTLDLYKRKCMDIYIFIHK